jgi:hypothetical protein
MERSKRPKCAAVLVAVVLALAACSESDGSIGVSGRDGTVEDSLQPTTAVSSTVASETRTVPTVMPSTLPGQPQTGTIEPGVINAAPTIAPEQPASAASDASATSQAPPTTDLIGDPQPSPDTTAAPPPSTLVPPPPACERLIGVGVDGVVADNAGSISIVDDFAVGACRFDAGFIVVEVSFVSQATIRDDWYQRAGIEPVGEVGGEAVGISSFIPLTGPVSDGCTIALVGGSEGVVVAVRSTSDARSIASQIAIFANQAA